MAARAPLSARGARDPPWTTASSGTPSSTTGSFRPRNPLLLRDEIGRSRPSCFQLPGEGFAYGRPMNLDIEGAREVSGTWVDHVPSKPVQNKTPNFVDFNKKALHAKTTTAKDLKQMRKELNVSQMGASLHQRHTSLPKGPLPSDFITDFAYGKKVRPSTPINQVLTARDPIQTDREFPQVYLDLQEARQLATAQVRKIHFTTASRGHAYGAKKILLQQDEDKDFFKLTRFKHAQSKLTPMFTKRGPEEEGSVLPEPSKVAASATVPEPSTIEAPRSVLDAGASRCTAEEKSGAGAF